MDFDDTAEHAALRAAVAQLTARFGGDYYTARARAGEPCDELWKALAEAGFIGVNVPAEYGGGGTASPSSRSSARKRRRRAARCCCSWCPAPSRPRCSPGTAASGSASAGCRASRTARARWCSPSPSPTRLEHATGWRTTATPRRDGWVLTGTKYYISGVDEAARILVVARTGPADERGQRPAGAVPRARRHARACRRTGCRWTRCCRRQQFTLHFDDVRLGPGRRWSAAKATGSRQVFHGLNPERITGAALGVGVGPVRPGPGRAVRAHPDGLGRADRHPPGRGPPAGQSEDRDRTGRADDRQGRLAARPRPARPARRRTWPSTRRLRPRWPRWIRPSRRMAATACPPSTGCSRYWGTGPAAPDRPGEPGDGAQLRGPAQPRPAEVILTAGPGRPRAAC